MTFILGICVAVTFGVSIYMLLGRDLKGVAMGVFLLGHAANLSILTMSGSPVIEGAETEIAAPEAALKAPPLGKKFGDEPLTEIVDPLPQALILTAIVIGFAVMGFLLTLLVVTSRSTQTLELEELKGDASTLSDEPLEQEGRDE
jgi:multicomponent Na+:H+ antiporter subunit C